jgi:hypothetical protein
MLKKPTFYYGTGIIIIAGICELLRYRHSSDGGRSSGYMNSWTPYSEFGIWSLEETRLLENRKKT